MNMRKKLGLDPIKTGWRSQFDQLAPPLPLPSPCSFSKVYFKRKRDTRHPGFVLLLHYNIIISHIFSENFIEVS